MTSTRTLPIPYRNPYLSEIPKTIPNHNLNLEVFVRVDRQFLDLFSFAIVHVYLLFLYFSGNSLFTAHLDPRLRLIFGFLHDLTIFIGVLQCTAGYTLLRLMHFFGINSCSRCLRRTAR